jgi:hypothetical protein
VLDHIGARNGEAYFWGTHAGAELDLLVIRGRTDSGSSSNDYGTVRHAIHADSNRRPGCSADGVRRH